MCSGVDSVVLVVVDMNVFGVLVLCGFGVSVCWIVMLNCL